MDFQNEQVNSNSEPFAGETRAVRPRRRRSAAGQESPVEEVPAESPPPSVSRPDDAPSVQRYVPILQQLAEKGELPTQQPPAVKVPEFRPMPGIQQRMPAQNSPMPSAGFRSTGSPGVPDFRRQTVHPPSAPSFPQQPPQGTFSQAAPVNNGVPAFKRVQPPPFQPAAQPVGQSAAQPGFNAANPSGLVWQTGPIPSPAGSVPAPHPSGAASGTAGNFSALLHNKRLILFILAAVLIIVGIIVITNANSPQSQVYALVSRYEQAVNKEDRDAVMRCSVAGINGSFDFVWGRLNQVRLKLTPYKFLKKGNNGLVYVHCTIIDDSGSEKKDVTASVTQVNGKWYFSKDQSSYIFDIY